MSTSTAARLFKTAFQAMVVTAIASANTDGRILVDRGYPPRMPDTCILILGAKSEQVWRTTGRGRNEALTLSVAFAAWRVGATAQGVSEDVAYDLLERVAAYLRSTDPTLTVAGAPAGLIEEVILTEFDETGFTERENRAAGRGTVIEAKFTARAKIIG